MKVLLFVVGMTALLRAPGAQAQDPGVRSVSEDSVLVRVVDAELRLVVQALSKHLDRPLIMTGDGSARVTVETPGPISRDSVLPLLKTLLRAQGMQLVEEEGAYRIAGGPNAQEIHVPQAEGILPGTQLFVMRLRHAAAADVAATVNALYGRAAALAEIGSQVQSLGQQLAGTRIPPFEQTADAPEQIRIGHSAELSGEITIVPDERTNSLLIRASQLDFELIRAAVDQLDIRPLQVLIEVVIAEVRRDRTHSIGLQSALSETGLRHSDGVTIEASAAGMGVGDFAMHVRNVAGADWDLTLRAAAARGDVSIISRPVIFTANNETAHILVGSQRPFVQVQRALPTDAPIRDQVVQYKDVGTQLTVTPTISEDGFVMLDVLQEVNAATTETAFDAPVISTRSVRTHLLVQDGQTAVLGGLTDAQRDANKSGVPFLSEIPVIGWLFGRTSNRTTDTELFIFITPRVVDDPGSLDAVSDSIRQDSRLLRRLPGAPQGPGGNMPADSVPDR